MDYSIIISIVGILISMVSIYNSWQTRKESKERFAIETISDACKIEPCYSCLLYTSPSPRDTR